MDISRLERRKYRHFIFHVGGDDVCSLEVSSTCPLKRDDDYRTVVRSINVASNSGSIPSKWLQDREIADGSFRISVVCRITNRGESDDVISNGDIDFVCELSLRMKVCVSVSTLVP
jgi:hypothetical protein